MLAVLIAGCGGTRPAPEAPAPQVSASAPVARDVGDPLPPDSIVQTMQAQAVLDHPQVQAFLHLELEGNRPLTVFVAPALAQGARDLRAGGDPVQVVADAAGARVHLTSRESLGGPRVRVGVAIPAEGVAGHVDVELADYAWTAVGAELSER